MIGHAGLGGKVVHLIIHDDPVPGIDNLGTELGVDRSPSWPPIALGIGGGNVGRVL